ncbi:hypothetical protein CRUP_003949 [Coryphaenoides rupestris]|nr:hypothetical protein CRUP_003949 [Coryphaenoides rupestris]
MIQQFENHSEMPGEEGGDGDPQRLSSSSLGEDSLDRSLENPTPPYTPRSRRRSMESPLALLPDSGALEEEEVCDGHNWQATVPAQLLSTLSPREVERQAVIYELFTTEVSHLRTLRVLDQVFFQKMRSVLSSEELACIFPNLPQFEGSAGEGFADQASQLCSQQSEALELLRSKQRKTRFAR